MSINFQPSFLGIGMRNVGHIMLPENFKIQRPNCGEFCVISKKSPGYSYDYTTEITPVKNGKNVLSSSFYGIDNGDVLYVDSMRTENLIRNIGLGTCLHLTHIIEMLENGAKSIELQAAPFAIPFHTRLGFKPINTWGDFLEKNLSVISSETDERLASYKDDAVYILNCKYSNDLKAIYAIS